MRENISHQNNEKDQGLEVLREGLAIIRLFAFNEKLAKSMNDIFDTEELLKITDGNFEDVDTVKLRWFHKNAETIEKWLEKMSRKSPEEQDKRNAEILLIKVKAAKLNTNLYFQRKNPRLKRITNTFKKILFKQKPEEQNEIPLIEKIKKQEVTINSQEIFKACIAQVAETLSQLSANGETMEVQDLSYLEERVSQRITPLIERSIAGQEGNALNFYLYIEKRMLEIKEGEDDVWTALKMIQISWVGACIKAFQKNAGPIILAIQDEGDKYARGEREKIRRIFENTRERLLNLFELFGRRFHAPY